MKEVNEIERLRKERNRAEKANNLEAVGAVCGKIGELFCQLGKYEEAVNEYERELQICELLTPNDLVTRAVAHRRIGECHSELGEYEAALRHEQLYLELAVRGENVVEEQRAFATLGRTHFQHAERHATDDPAVAQKALQDAEIAFTQSLNTCRRLKGTISAVEYNEMKSRLLLNFGLVYDCRGDVRMCVEYNRHAIKIAQKHKLLTEVYRCQFNLAAIYQRTSNLHEALRYINDAIKTAALVRDKCSEWEARITKGRIFLWMGNFAAAKHALLKAIKKKADIDKAEEFKIFELLKPVMKLSKLNKTLLSTTTDDQQAMMCLFEKIGDIAAGLECYEVALQNYLSMEKCAQLAGLSDLQMIPIYISLAQTYADLSQYKQASLYYNKELACRTGDHVQQCRTLLNIASVQELDGQDYNVVRQTYDMAYEHASIAEHRILQAIALDNLRTAQEKFNAQADKKDTEEKLNRFCVEHDLDIDKLTVESSHPQDDDSSDKAEDDDDDNDESGLMNIRDISDSYSDESSDGEELSGVRPTRLKKHSNLMKTNEKGETLLHQACIEGNLKTVKMLIEKGHPVNPRDHCGWLPLHEAANHNHAHIVEYLLLHGANIDDRGGDLCEGITPLHDACSGGYLDVIQLFIDHKANLLAADNKGNTPLDTLKDYRTANEKDFSESELGNILRMERQIEDLMATKYPASQLVAVRKQQTDYQSQRLKRKRSTAAPGCLNSLMSTRPSGTASKPREGIPALIPEDQNVGDDWLIRDVASPKHKRKYNIDEIFTMSPKRKIRNRSANLRAGQTKFTKRIRRNSTKVAKSREIDEEDDQESSRHAADDSAGSFEEYDEKEDLGSDSDLLVVSSRLSDSDKNSGMRLTDDDEGSRTSDISQTTRTLDRTETHIVVEDENEPLVHDLLLNIPHVRTQRRQSGHRALHPGDIRDFLCRTKPKQNTAAQQRLKLSREPGVITLAMHGTDNDTSSVVQQRLVMRLKVRVDGKLILVPVYNSDTPQTISWLSGEVSDRYFQLFGVRPVVTLTLPDGAKLAPNDLVSSIFLNNEELVGCISDWNIAPLPQRYVDACSGLKSSLYSNIKRVLEDCERKGKSALALSNLVLQTTSFQPVARALQYQDALCDLRINNNKLGDEGFSHLMEVLPMLRKLSVLDLSCNGLSSASLRKLSATLNTLDSDSRTFLLPNLQELTLSYNPLFTNSTDSLGECLISLQRIRRIYLVSCGINRRNAANNLMSHTSSNADSWCIEELDIGLNMIGSLGVESILNAARSSKLRCLCLDQVVDSVLDSHHLLKTLTACMQSGRYVLDSLSLDGCIMDSVTELCLLLSSAGTLHHLSISSNDIITTDIQRVIDACSDSLSCQLQTLTFNACSISSPLPTSFFDALAKNLQKTCALRHLRFTVDELSSVDKEQLTYIWVTKWTNVAVCEIVGESVELKLSVF